MIEIKKPPGLRKQNIHIFAGSAVARQLSRQHKLPSEKGGENATSKPSTWPSKGKTSENKQREEGWNEWKWDDPRSMEMTQAGSDNGVEAWALQGRNKRKVLCGPRSAFTAPRAMKTIIWLFTRVTAEIDLKAGTL